MEQSRLYAISMLADCTPILAQEQAGITEYVKIWNSTGWNVTATWEGYTGDWHNISFGEPFTLKADEEYNYTIITGSYPQVIHEPSFNATGGTITCEGFRDVNGKTHTNWIPAIKLY